MASSAARALDVIDARPRYTQADADALNRRFKGVDAQTMLRALFAEDELGEIAVVSSFGTESAVLLHLIAKADPVLIVAMRQDAKPDHSRITGEDFFRNDAQLAERTTTSLAG